MDYAIISAGQALGEGAGKGPGQGVFRWAVSEPAVPGEQLGQMLKRYKNRMIIVVDAGEAEEMVARLNQDGGQDAAQAIADATAAGAAQSIS